MDSKTESDKLTGSLLDMLSYVIPGALGVVAIYVPLGIIGIVSWKAITLGEALLAFPIMYFLGVLFSSARPRRFYKSDIGADEEAFDTTLKDPSMKALFIEAVEAITLGKIEPLPWSIEKNIMLRFYLAEHYPLASEYIRRQLALRQLRYNSCVPIALLGAEFVLIPLLSVVNILPYVASVPLAIAGVCISILVCKSLNRAASANVRRETIYVYTAAIALYFKAQENGQLLHQQNDGVTTV